MSFFNPFKKQSTPVASVSLNGTGRIPFPAYWGNEPYLFISYAHADAQMIYKEIVKFHNQGYNVWYDEGISPGNEWTDDIAEALTKCALFVVFFTPRSAISPNVQNEINFAIDEKIPFIAIHLEPTILPSGIKLRIGSKQAILKYNMSEEEYDYKYQTAFERMGLKAGKRVKKAVEPTDLNPTVTAPTVVKEAKPVDTHVSTQVQTNTLTLDFITIKGKQYSTSLTELSLFDMDLQNEDIVPLQYIKNLTKLILAHNKITDLTPLSGIVNLSVLDLTSNQISDLTPLSGLTNLTNLILWTNQISDLTPLSSLVKLTDLNLWGNKISDLLLLSGLTKLSVLNLLGNKISDLTPLSTLTNLTDLILAYNQLHNLAPLSLLTNLRRLDISHNQISDLTPLSSLKYLLNVWSEGNPITDWSPVAHISYVIGRPEAPVATEPPVATSIEIPKSSVLNAEIPADADIFVPNGVVTIKMEDGTIKKGVANSITFTNQLQSWLYVESIHTIVPITDMQSIISDDLMVREGETKITTIHGDMYDVKFEHYDNMCFISAEAPFKVETIQCIEFQSIVFNWGVTSETDLKYMMIERKYGKVCVAPVFSQIYRYHGFKLIGVIRQSWNRGPDYAFYHNLSFSDEIAVSIDEVFSYEIESLKDGWYLVNIIKKNGEIIPAKTYADISIEMIFLTNAGIVCEKLDNIRRITFLNSQ